MGIGGRVAKKGMDFGERVTRFRISDSSFVNHVTFFK